MRLAIEVVEAYGQSWVIVAGSGSNSLSVMGLRSDGRLIPKDHVLDTLNTRFESVQDLSVIEVNGRAFIVAGGSDDVSVYGAIRSIFEEARGTERHLLTFNHANHNAAAPIPAPRESWEPVESLDFVPFEHYADPVWDTVRMNNIAQHFATAFFDLHLRGDVSRRPYFDLIPSSDDGVTALDEEALPTDDHTYWVGFPDRTARGLRFETLAEGE